MKTEQMLFDLNVDAPKRHDTARAEFIAAALSVGPAGEARLMESICEPGNMDKAMWRVIANDGAPGVDGMSVKDLPAFVRRNAAAIKAAMREATYKPLPVRRKEIEKPEGGTRLLGIPAVADRYVQQSVAQILQVLWDHSFSDSSYGYRPERSQAEAAEQFRRHVEEGYTYVVSLDLSKFFDRVNHDRLMSRLATRISDKRVLKLIRAFLKSGIDVGNGDVILPAEGTPQGGPLSPILSNIVLDELDKELERRGHRFVRYADDIVVLVRSQKAAERVLASLARFITKKLKLKVNEEKSRVERPWNVKFLGFRVSRIFGKTRTVIHPKALSRFKQRIREITRRDRGVGMKQIAGELICYLGGWKYYYAKGLSIALKKALNRWIIRRLKAFLWNQWRLPRTKVRMLKRLGLDHATAVRLGNTRKSAWRASRFYQLNFALPEKHFWQKYGLKLIA